MSDKVLTKRLLEHVNPFFGLFGKRKPSLFSIMQSVPQDVWIDEEDRDYEWHIGRIRHFIEEADQGRALDPVEVDWVWDRMIPLKPQLLDGYHRLCAAALADLPTVLVDYGGPVDFLEYLKGETECCEYSK